MHRVPLWPEQNFTVVTRYILKNAFIRRLQLFITHQNADMRLLEKEKSLLTWHTQPVPAVLQLRDSSGRSIQGFLSLLMSQLFLEENYCVYDLGAW